MPDLELYVLQQNSEGDAALLGDRHASRDRCEPPSAPLVESTAGGAARLRELTCYATVSDARFPPAHGSIGAPCLGR